MWNLIIEILRMLANLIRGCTKSGIRSLVAENLLLRTQLLALKRNSKKSPALRPGQRALLAVACVLISSKARLCRASIIVSPGTLLKFHRFLVKRKYRKLFSRKGKTSGRKGYSVEVRELVRNLRARNPDFGCLRIAQTVNELLGISISEQTVRRILRERKPPGTSKPIGPSWLTSFADTKDSLWSIDLFRVESINLKTHWVLAIIDVYSRKIVGYAVHAGNGVSGENLCYMFNRILGSSGSVPKRISRDRDPLFQFEQWKRNIDMLGVEELYGPSHTPTANPFVERLIGTTRREFLDKTFFLV